MNVNARMVARIDAALPFVSDEYDQEALTYVRSQITPTGLEQRTEGHEDVSHLLQAAEERLRRYEKERESDAA